MFIFYITEAVKSLSRAKFASFVLVLTTCIAIGFSSVSISLFFISSKIESKLKSRVELTVFLEEELENNQIQNVSQQLKSNKVISSIVFIDKETAKSNFVKETGHDFSKILDANPLPASYSVKLHPESVSSQKIELIATELKNIGGVNEVVYDYDFILKVLVFINSIKLIIYGVSLFLVLITIYFYFALNRFILHTKEKQLNTMKLVGSKLGAIRYPVFIASIIIGIIAAIICVFVDGAALYIISKFYHIPQLKSLLYFSSAGIMVIGTIFGIVGGFLSIKRISLNIDKR